jgi:fimbrial isopeptide formation D2 family protein/LPXTG-motif cell wall-anchored protein
MKKLIALVLALALVLAVAVASANTITIESNAAAGATNNTTYDLYQVLRLEKAASTTLGTPNEDTGVVAAANLASPVAYYLNSPAEDTLAGLLNATTYLTATKSADGTRWNITLTGSPTGAELAATLNTDAIKAAAIKHEQKTANGNANVVFDNETDGYYLIVASNGTKLIAQSLGDVTIKEKNTYITDVKTVEEADLAVGEIAHFTITVHVPATAVVGEEITVHDTMDSELDYNDDVAATFNGAAVTLTDGTKKANTELFAKKFTITEDMLDHDVVLTYTATVNETADSDEDGFVNTSFANDSNFETLPTTVRVYTFDFDLDKNFADVTGDDAANYSATFNMSKGGNTLKFKDLGNHKYVLAEDQTATTGVTTDLVVDGLNNINVTGLDAGEYVLTEIATAPGYNLMTETITVTITDTTPAASKNDPSVEPTWTVSYQIGSGDVATGTVTIVNNKGTQLPSTGGIGTTIFYILGGLLVIGAAVILVARRKAQD